MNRRPGTDIGDVIRRAREKSGLTQDELSLRAGLSVAAVAQWEKRTNPARPSLHSLEKVCAVLGITIAELFADAISEGPQLTDIEDEALFLFKRLDREQQRAFIQDLRAAVLR